MKIPKKYLPIIRDFYKDEDGYWVNLKEGYITGVDECRTIHVDTMKEVIEELKQVTIQTK